MKKITAIVIMLFLFSIGSYSMIGHIVSKEKASVTIKENILFGDKSYAEGISVEIRAQYNEHLYWNTSYTIGDNPTTTTDYEFYPNENHEGESYTDKPGAVELAPKPESVSSFKPVNGKEYTGLQKALQEIYEATPGGYYSGEKLICLQDYYYYFPIRISINVPGIPWSGTTYSDLSDEKEIAVWDAFNEFFKIPIPRGLPGVYAHVSTSNQDMSISLLGDVTYPMNPQSVYTKDTVFFSIANRASNNPDSEKYLDMSQVPGGYGIYAFSYVSNAKDAEGSNPSGEKAGIDADSLAMVFPLEEHVRVIKMMLNNDESELLLFTKEQGITYLTVIDIPTMTELQKIKVTEETDYEFFEYDSCIALMTQHAILVIEKQANGLCKLAFTISRTKDFNIRDFYISYLNTMVIDGDKLIIVVPDTPYYSSLQEGCGFTIAIYDSTGPVYLAEYESNLFAENDVSHRFSPVRYEIIP